MSLDARESRHAHRSFDLSQRSTEELVSELIPVATAEEGSLSDRMCVAFPWMAALSQSDLEKCTRELLDAARASFAVGQPHLALVEYDAWRDTATAIVAGLANLEPDWLDGTESVARP